MKIRTLLISGIAGLMLSACSTSTPIEAKEASSGEMYRIKDGENLMLIAERVYGSRYDWEKIYEANRDTIDDPTLVYPDQVIILP